MTTAEIILRTTDYVKNRLAGDSSGHDWWHIEQVWRREGHHAQEGGDLLVIELAALLHDIGDWKFHGGDESVGPRLAHDWLASLGVMDDTVDHVCQIIAGLSFKGAGVKTEMASLEGRIVQDADRLDAIGAIGIGRAFAYGGHAGRAMYDPAVPPERHDSFAAYKKNAGPTINHFYEKLLLLQERMNTAGGRALAADRHLFMEEFLRRFFDEWGKPAGPPASTSDPS